MNNFLKNLRNIFFSVLVLNNVLDISAQDTIIMSNGISSTCNGYFFDSALNGDYGNNENFTHTICPSTDSLKTKITFTQFNLSIGDSLCVYNGPTTSSALIGCFSGTTLLNLGFQSEDSCLTFKFTSNGNGTNVGFEGRVTCSNCQLIVPALSNALIDTAGFIDICPNTTITLSNATTYPENNTYYTQSNATSACSWDLTQSFASGQSVNATYEDPGFYPIYLNVTDVNGCEQKAILANVRVSGAPNFAGSSAFPGLLCSGDSVFLDGFAAADTFSLSYQSRDTIVIFLDDIQGVEFTGVAEVNQFNANQLVTSGADIEKICITMEHSYIGDLEMNFLCPNGTSIELHNQGGGGTFLGEPFDSFDPIEDSNLGPGVGYLYCWVDDAPNGTWVDYDNIFNATTMPSGDYAPNESFSGLIGCPLNGVWTISILDELPSDNGFIFNWQIFFNAATASSEFSFSPSITSVEWIENTASLSNSYSYDYVPSQSGSLNYIFSVEDEFGCTYDTSFTVNVVETPVASFSTDLQENAEAPLNISFFNSSTPSNVQSTWYLGDSIFSTVYNPLTQTYTNGGEFVVTLVARNGACIDSISDTLLILLVNEVPNVFSPNADNLNDAFYVPAIGIGSYAVQIFNRWGKSVFECSTSGMTTECAWDGKVNDGSDAPDGTYYYFIDVLNKAGEPLDVENAQGYVQLMRN